MLIIFLKLIPHFLSYWNLHRASDNLNYQLQFEQTFSTDYGYPLSCRAWRSEICRFCNREKKIQSSGLSFTIYRTVPLGISSSRSLKSEITICYPKYLDITAWYTVHAVRVSKNLAKRFEGMLPLYSFALGYWDVGKRANGSKNKRPLSFGVIHNVLLLQFIILSRLFHRRLLQYDLPKSWNKNPCLEGYVSSIRFR